MASAADLVKVRLDTPRPQVQISGFGLQIAAAGELHSLRLIPAKDKILVSVRGGEWRIEILRATKSDNEILKYTSKDIKVTGEMLRLGIEEVPNELTLFANEKNRIEPIAQIELEEYLKGVIPSEMPAKWPLEALKAQAIASRSYALHVKRERLGERYHLDASTNHQVFKLINYLGAKGPARDKIVRAVEDTRGVVLLDARGATYKAFYHADCGGATEEPRAVWGYGPHNGTVKDSGCAISGHGVWQAQVPIEKLDQEVRASLKVPAEYTFIDLRVTKPTENGRISEIAFIYSDRGSRAQSFEMSTQRFREVFGFDVIKSTRFSILRSSEEFRFNGRGHGHGAGMCQFGARFMAMAGSKYAQILRRYYPEAKLPEVGHDQSVAVSSAE